MIRRLRSECVYCPANTLPCPRRAAAGKARVHRSPRLSRAPLDAAARRPSRPRRRTCRTTAANPASMPAATSESPLDGQRGVGGQPALEQGERDRARDRRGRRRCPSRPTGARRPARRRRSTGGRRAVEVQQHKHARRFAQVVDPRHGFLAAVAALVQVHRPCLATDPAHFVGDRPLVGVDAEAGPQPGHPVRLVCPHARRPDSGRDQTARTRPAAWIAAAPRRRPRRRAGSRRTKPPPGSGTAVPAAGSASTPSASSTARVGQPRPQQRQHARSAGCDGRRRPRKPSCADTPAAARRATARCPAL